MVNGVIDVLGIQGPDGLPVPLNGALDGIGPRAHIVQIGLGNRQVHHRPPGGKVQILCGKDLPHVGDPLGLAGENQGELGHGPASLIGLNICLRVLRPGHLLGNQHLKLRLTVQNGLNGVLKQVQAFTQVLNGGFRHLLGYFV